MSREKWGYGAAICDVKKRFPSPQMFGLKRIKTLYQFDNKEAQHVLDHGVELGYIGQMGHLYYVKRQTAPAQGKGENENPNN